MSDHIITRMESIVDVFDELGHKLMALQAMARHIDGAGMDAIREKIDKAMADNEKISALICGDES